jgi:hypothetical protein
MNPRQQEMAAKAAFEALIACAGVTREQLKRWTVTFEEDVPFVTFVFKNHTSSRRMEVDVSTNFEPIQNGIKVSVCITLIAEYGQVKRPNIWVDVLFPPVQPKTNQRTRFEMFRRRAA